jgi:hypothetical protein
VDGLEWARHIILPSGPTQAIAAAALAPREGWCYQHVQAIIVSIDQYAEAALGNREFFLNKPYGIGGRMKDDIP